MNPEHPKRRVVTLEGELTSARNLADELAEALRLTEFGFMHSRCPVCAGFNVGPAGETDHAHTKTCPVAKVLARYDAERK